MRLKRLELQGFKSFLDRTIISFDNNITGVVGPNGCGKSNIVDAIVWVLGEQSAKHLRGDSMSDVIFNGSDTKAPTSMAEVTLVMDKQGMMLPTALANLDRGEEISVTRRLYRDGTAEYLVNKQICRLKDIHELFMDTGVGRRAYSIIEQGSIDRMVNVKPEDRRYIFEEVAGITKYRTKRREAERKIEGTRLNLDRLQDLLSELEKRMRSLKVQASRARKYKDIKIELEAIDIFLLGRRLHDLKAKIDHLTESREQLQLQKAEWDSQLGRSDATVTDLEVKRIDLEKQMEDLDQRERSLAIQVQRLESQIALFEEQHKHCLSAQQSRTDESNQLESRIESLVQEKAQVFEEQQKVEAEVESAKQVLSDFESALHQVRSDREALEDRQMEMRSEGERLLREETALVSQIENSQVRQKEKQSERDELNRKLSEAAENLRNFNERARTLDLQIESHRVKEREEIERLAQLDSDFEGVSEKVSNFEVTLSKLREEFHGKRSRLQSLEELQQGLEGYCPTAKEILLKLGEQVSAVPLAEVLLPEKGLEAQVELLLGDTIHTLLVRSCDEARTISQIITERGLEKVNILAQEEIAPSERVIPLPQSTPLMTRVQSRSGFENVVQYFLGNVFLCGSREELFELRRNYPESTFLCEKQPLIAHQGRILTCGSQPTKTGIFERRREIAELTQLIAQLQGELEESDRERSVLLDNLKRLEACVDDAKEGLSKLQLETVSLGKEREKLQAEQNRADRDYNSLSELSERNHTALDTLHSELERMEKARVEVGERRAETERVAQSSEGEWQALEERVASLETERSVKRVEISRYEERLQGFQQQVTRLEQEILSQEQRRDVLVAKQSEEQRRAEELLSLRGQVIEQKGEAQKQQGELTVQLEALKQVFQEVTEQVTQLRAEKEKIRESREGLINDLQQLELSLQEDRSHFEHERSLSVERYHREAIPLDEKARIELKDLPLFASNVRVDWVTLPREEKEMLLGEHLVSLRQKAERYGEVNLTAINEFDEVEQRFTFLSQQKEDLETSIRTLEDAIKRIDETTKTRFTETVEGVNQKFQEVFPILFSGGKARLTLTDPENLLESGVDIMVQPPGKRPQSISLLSGGEKALTAVSLILAIFARKPSPFCLLDEVDAPLDDANVARFNTVIKHMAKKSQFILVTHNRRTMEVAEALYGVTMERAGVSKMTSVQL